MTKTVQDLAAQNASMLRDTVNPSAPLTDNAITIAERFDGALAALIARMTAEVHARYAEHFSNLPLPTFKLAPYRKGQRFLALWDYNNDPHCGNERRIVGFIETGTGLMWKAQTWKAPATNFPRGCIFDLDAIPVGALAHGTFSTLPGISLEAIDPDAYCSKHGCPRSTCDESHGKGR